MNRNAESRRAMSLWAYDHAIVIGGSVAGLAAARVLLHRFNRVTIIERDRLPDTPDIRKGVPQARHPHAMLLRGRQELERLFPGLLDELTRVGAENFNLSTDSIWYTGARRRPHYPTYDLFSTAVSRSLLEHTIYCRMRAEPRLRFIQAAEVTGLCLDSERRRATGVRLRARPGADLPEAEQILSADLIVDASGRGSRAPDWLNELGYPPPEETVISAQSGYATRVYQRLPGIDWKLLFVQPSVPDQSRGAMIMALEGGRWNVTMIGIAGDYPPTDEQAFLDFAGSLPTPAVADLLSRATPLGPIHGYRRTENRLRHYERLPRYLERFVVCGDAAAALNPVYGQGITLALVSVAALERSLWQSRGLDGLARAFQRRLAGEVAGAWQLATSEDLRWLDATSGKQPSLVDRLAGSYIESLLDATFVSQEVMHSFHEIQQMLAGPALLARPDVVYRVLRGAARFRREAQAGQRESAASSQLDPVLR